MTTLLHIDASARRQSISREVGAAFAKAWPRRFVVAAARGGSYADGTPKAAFDYQERYLRDFFSGHFAVPDTAFITAELVNARHDPALAHLRENHERSYAFTLETAHRLGKEY